MIFELDDDRRADGDRPARTNDVALPWDPEVSRVHAELERIGGDWVLCDEGLSHNGTCVNGERVRGRRRLRGGDVVAVGETLIAFCAPGGGSVREPDAHGAPAPAPSSADRPRSGACSSRSAAR